MQSASVNAYIWCYYCHRCESIVPPLELCTAHRVCVFSHSSIQFIPSLFVPLSLSLYLSHLNLTSCPLVFSPEKKVLLNFEWEHITFHWRFLNRPRGRESQWLLFLCDYKIIYSWVNRNYDTNIYCWYFICYVPSFPFVSFRFGFRFLFFSPPNSLQNGNCSKRHFTRSPNKACTPISQKCKFEVFFWMRLFLGIFLTWQQYCIGNSGLWMCFSVSTWIWMCAVCTVCTVHIFGKIQNESWKCPRNSSEECLERKYVVTEQCKRIIWIGFYMFCYRRKACDCENLSNIPAHKIVYNFQDDGLSHFVVKSRMTLRQNCAQCTLFGVGSIWNALIARSQWN